MRCGVRRQQESMPLRLYKYPVPESRSSLRSEASALVILYGIIEFRLFYYAFKTSEYMYKIILGGAGVYLFMHFFLNAGGVASLIPFTGVPLLFISSGGTSLISIMLTMGLAQNCICAIRRREMDRLS